MFERLIYRLLGWHFREIKHENERIDVLEKEGEKRVLVNGATYSLIKSSIYTNSYWDYFLPLIGMHEKPDVLMIGLGAGTIAYQSNALFPNAKLDVVEIDREMVKIAKELDPKMNANIVIDDGARFIASAKKKYDLIILDAYRGIKIPAVFMGEPFISNAERALKQYGVLAINYARSISEREALLQYVARLKTRFDVHMVSAKPTTENVIIVCTRGIGEKELFERIGKSMEWNSSNRFILESYGRMAKF